MSTSTERPHALANQLRWVHDTLRHDLAIARELADRVAAGAGPAEVRDGLAELESGGLLFQLRATCLGYCQLVGRHHGGEDETLFPAVRRAAPHLASTVDRLEADHREVAAMLAEVDALALGLDDDTSARTALSESLTRLSVTLLDHLAREEEAIDPVLDRWQAWPSEAPPPQPDAADGSGSRV